MQDVTQTGSRRTRAAADAAVAVAGGSAVTVLAVVVLSATARAGGQARVLAVSAFVVGMLVLAVVGRLVLVRRLEQRTIGVLLLAVGALGLLGRAAIGLAVAAPEQTPAWLAWLTNWVWVPGAGSVLVLLLRFPTGDLPAQQWRWVERLVLGWTATAIVLTAIAPGPLAVEPLDRNNPLGLEGAQWLLSLLAPVFGLLPVLTVVACGALLVRYRGARPEQRQQLRWVAAAVAVLAVAAPVSAIAGAGELPEALAYLLLPAALVVAVLRHRLYDLSLVVRRTAVYGLACTVLLVTYVGVVTASQALLRGLAPDLVATAVVAIAAVPVLGCVQRLVERLLFGERHDPDRVVAELGDRLASTPEALLPLVVEQVARSLRLPHVAVELPDGTVAAAHGTGRDSCERLRIEHGGRLVGWLLAGRRTGGEPLAERDLVLLRRLAAHAGLAVRSTELNTALQRTTERLRLARDSERARLRRELHDELGPALGAVSMRAEAGRNLVATGADPKTVDTVLQLVQDGAAAAVVEVRRILDELHPQALEELGLERALQQAAAGVPDGLRVEFDITAPARLPLDVEMAAYRICGEALRNTVRHASATTAHLRVLLDGDVLEVLVIDDGVGIPIVPAQGVGLGSMQARAAALGGSVEISGGSEGGTTVRARLPVPR